MIDLENVITSEPPMNSSYEVLVLYFTLDAELYGFQRFAAARRLRFLDPEPPSEVPNSRQIAQPASGHAQLLPLLVDGATVELRLGSCTSQLR